MPLIKPSSYEKRKEIWDKTIETTETHIKLAQAIYGNGVELLKKIKDKIDNGDDSVIILQKATACIEKGIKLEMQARDKLITLHNEEPKE